MKRILLLALSCFCLAFSVRNMAAPPLRALMPMHLANDSMAMPTVFNMVQMPEYGCCAAPAMISEGSSHQKFSPQFDIVGPLTLPENLAYYGGTAEDGSDDNFHDLCRDVTDLAKDVVSDWSIYDNDNDGCIELVCVIFAGYSQNQQGGNSTIWAKASYQNVKLNDNLRISRFNCSSELFHPSEKYSNYINGTGVLCVGTGNDGVDRDRGTEADSRWPTSDSRPATAG